MKHEYSADNTAYERYNLQVLNNLDFLYTARL